MVKYRYFFLTATLITILALFASEAGAASKKLGIPPIAQLLPQWCWVTVSEMVFRYYYVPNVNPAGIYQCGIVAAELGGVCNADCRLCPGPAGSAERLVHTIENYPGVAADLRNKSKINLNVQHVSDVLSEEQIVDDINNERPIVAGISPTSGSLKGGGSQHVALIIGYSNDGKKLLVNDPYPWKVAGVRDPYLKAGGILVVPGRYRIDREVFIDSLRWAESFRIAEGGSPNDLLEEQTEISYCDAIRKFTKDGLNFISNSKGTKISDRNSNTKRFSTVKIDDFSCYVDFEVGYYLSCEKKSETADDAGDDLKQYVGEADRCFAKLEASISSVYTRYPEGVGLDDSSYDKEVSYNYNFGDWWRVISTSLITSRRDNGIEIHISTYKR